MRVFKLRSLKSKIITLFVLSSGMVLIVQIVVFQNWISSIIVEKSDTYFKETVYQIGARVELQMQHFEQMAIGISNNQAIKNYLEDINQKEVNYTIAKYKITRELLRQTNLKVVDNINIYPLFQEPINFYYTEPHPEIEKYTRSLLQPSSWNNKEEVIWKVFDQLPYQITVFLPFKDEGKILGLLRISVNEQFFSGILDYVQLGKEGTLYLGSGGKVVFAKDRSVIHSPLSDLMLSSGTSVVVPLNNQDWSLIGLVPQQELVDQINDFYRIFLLMVVLIFAAVLFFALATARLILKPLKRVIKGMESIQKGDLNVILDHHSNDEFSIITRNFNYMVKRIHDLLETVYRQQVSYRKAEMQAVQAKLDPHFLYNTLDMIYWLLIVKEEEEIGEVIVALSGILRYSISHQNQYVTVAEDIAQLENYLKIQKMRFDDKLHYEFRVDEEAMPVKIPKLLIQPLVENAIKYAFQNMQQIGTLELRGFIDQQDLIFQVIDNGIGMPEEVMRSFDISHEHPSGKTGIGIQLVHQRARYVYGEGYGISIESTPAKGSKVTVRLGIKTEFNHGDMG